MNPDDQPSIPSKPPGASRPGATGMWQAPSVEEMQAMLPQYEILEILGRGGMGAVYKGRQKSLKRLVAIKILPPDAADDEMRFVERFENEAQTMAAMNHPAIVSVYDFGETAEGLLYFIMEFVDGTDVHKMIQTSGKLGDDYALAITAHVCDALDYAHSRGVIHRDIKPANILIDQDGRVKVADFGLAKMHDPSMTSGLTRTNMAMGTPDYVAPEALSIGMVVDHRADLYAVGVMLYQMLTGEVPRGMFRMPSEKGIGTDPRFDEIICKAMESDRDHRYQTASEVRHALDVILTTPQPKNDGTGVVPLEAIPRKVVLNVPGGPIGQSAVVPSRSQAAPPKKVPGKAVVAKGPASPSGKSSTGLWVTIVGVVVAIAVAAIFLMGGKPEPAARVQPAFAGSVSTSPVDAAFLAQVAAAPAARQVELVEQKIEALNGTKVSAEPTITGEKVTGLRLFRKDATEGAVHDISPLAALKDLDSLQLEYLTVGDITCLRGMKLVKLNIWDGKFTDVSVLQSFPLQTLGLKQTSISDFSVLKGKALERLDLEWCYNLSDLSFVKGMPLKHLRVPKTKVRDFSPIAGLPLVELTCDPEARLDPALLASIPTLKKINLKPVSEWQGGSSSPSSTTTGKVIDLLALVDVKRDTVAGEWVRTAEGLAKQGPGTTDQGAPRLQLPYEPPEEYDFEVEFTAVGDNQSVGQILSAQSRVFSWIVAGNKAEAPTAGFELFDNEPTSRPSEVVAPMEENLKAGRRYVSRVEVRAGSVRGFLDGVKLVDWEGDFKRLSPGTTGTGNLRDDKHLGLRAARNVIFHKITVREITGTGKVDAGVSASTSPPASVMPPSIANWQDVTESVREKARSKPDLLVEPDVVRRERGNQPLGVTLTEVLKPSLAVRVTYTGEAQISLWVEKGLKTDSAYVLARQTETIFNRVDKENRALPLLPPVPHPADFDDSVPHELLLTLQNSVLRVWIDGRFVGEGQDDSFKQAGMMLTFTRQSAVSKVELAELDEMAGGAKTATKLDEAFIRAVGAAASPETLSGEALPNVTHWQDVTAMVREKARSKPDLLVEPDVVRRELGNQHLGVTLQHLQVTLTEDLKPSLAVRVTYTGEAQITLWFEKGLETEFAYVLARQPETIFNRVDKGNRTLPLLPPVPHPADFDDSVPHELLLTLQNSVLRVWIDDRFVGEGQDDSFKQAGTMLMFTKQSAVSKVELAELEITATPPATIEDAGKGAPGKSARAPLASTTKDAPFVNSLGMKFVPVPDTDVLFCIHETRYRDYAEYAKMAKESVDGGWKIQNRDGYEIKTSAGDHPVASVSWKDAQAFCKWLSEKEGLTYRLPTDREWSLAVGIGRDEEWKSDTTPATVFQVPDAFPWGREWPPSQGAGNYSDESRRAKAPLTDTKYIDGYDDGFPTTAPVMSFEANPLGLFDLGGNVWEWCEDWYSGERKQRVLRGGSWTNVERGLLLSSIRERYSPEIRRYNYGFRVVLEIAASTSPPAAANPPVSPSTTDPMLARTTWTDWLTPKLASGTFDGGQWKREAGGFTTDQSIAGYEVLPAGTRDGAMRVTFAMRESEGVMINVRETKVGSGRQQYTAQYTGTSLYLAHASSRLITEPMPKELRDLPEHTLEFRFEGENLIAILNDTHRISASHSQLTEGSCALALTKGVLVKKIEVQTSTPTLK